MKITSQVLCDKREENKPTTFRINFMDKTRLNDSKCAFEVRGSEALS